MVVLAVAAAAMAWHFRLSSWWLLVPGAVSAAVAILLYSRVSTCDAATSTERIFGGAIVFAVAFGGATSLTALFGAIRLARRGAGSRAIALQIVAFLSGGALAVGAFVLLVASLFHCLS
jgi:hypothetical protein